MPTGTYLRTKKHGVSISKGLRDGLSMKDYFWTKVNKTDTCWNWKGYIGINGYGRYGKKNLLAHRISWELHNGEIPKGLCVLHKCDNPPCIRPEHLFLGTKKDNTRDMFEKNRGNSPIGERNYGAKLTEIKIQAIRKIWKNSNLKQEKIGEMFNVGQSVISRIISNKSWKHVSVIK